MKCFTIQAKQDELVLPSFQHPMSYVAPELYPQPQAGIKVGRGQRDLEISPGVKAKLSAELLAACRTTGDDPDSLLIERASLVRLANGTLSIETEKPADENAALVLLDLGRGSFNNVRYEVGNRVFLRARRQCDCLYGTEELALVELPAGRPFYAYRSSRRWYCFGSEVVGERLQIRYDGNELSCSPAR